MSFRLHHNATWRDEFRDEQERDRDAQNAKRHITGVKQMCRDAVGRGDHAKLDEIQKHESGLDQFIDACRRRIENG